MERGGLWILFELRYILTDTVPKKLCVRIVHSFTNDEFSVLLQMNFFEIIVLLKKILAEFILYDELPLVLRVCMVRLWSGTPTMI